MPRTARTRESSGSATGTGLQRGPRGLTEGAGGRAIASSTENGMPARKATRGARVLGRLAAGPRWRVHQTRPTACEPDPEGPVEKRVNLPALLSIRSGDDSASDYRSGPFLDTVECDYRPPASEERGRSDRCDSEGSPGPGVSIPCRCEEHADNLATRGLTVGSEEDTAIGHLCVVRSDSADNVRGRRGRS